METIWRPRPECIRDVDSELVQRGPTRDSISGRWLVVWLVATVAMWAAGAIVVGAVAELLGW